MQRYSIKCNTAPYIIKLEKRGRQREKGQGEKKRGFLQMHYTILLHLRFSLSYTPGALPGLSMVRDET